MNPFDRLRRLAFARAVLQGGKEQPTVISCSNTAHQRAAGLHSQGGMSGEIGKMFHLQNVIFMTSPGII
jgi:hypothetical protein